MLKKYRITDNTPVNINPNKWFWGYALLHVFFWTLAATIFAPTIPFDSVEGYAWGNQWQWGYDKHPILAPWLTAFFVNHFGIGFGNYLLSQLCVLVAFIAIWQLAKKILSPVNALIAVFLLGAVDFYTLVSNKIDPDIITLATWALFILCFYNACKKETIWNWILVGVTAGLAMLSKYTTVLLLVSMLAFLIFNKDQREKFKKPGIYTGLITFIIVIAPNMIWLVEHNFVSITYVFNRGSDDAYVTYPILNHIFHPLRFILNEILRCLSVLLIAIPLFFCYRSTQKKSSFDQSFLLILFFGPFILAIVLSIILGTDIHSGWAFPFYTLSSILVMFWLQPEINLTAFKYVITLLVVISFGLLIACYTVMNTSPYFSKRAGEALYPMAQVANYINQEWQSKYHTQLKYVAGSRYLTAFMTAYSPQHPTPYYSWSTIHSAWINEAELKKSGAMFVWWADGATTAVLPADILARFPNVTNLHLVKFKMDTNANVPPLQIGIAELPPGK